jgi:regulator of protease activity HflC (stomatin/prohibitin superfamily)
MFKRFLVAGLALASLSACSYEKVPAGNVGVKYYLLGGDKGVSSQEVGPGRYFLTINEELYLFPTFTQNYTWQGEEAISFQTREGLNVSADIGISYSVQPDKVAVLFEKYRKGIEEITDLYLRNMVRDALVTSASTQPIETVYGAGKAELISEVEVAVRQQVAPLGINVERIYWIGQLSLPPNVVGAINAKIQATQMAEQRRNEVEQAKAEAEKLRQSAQGSADAKLLLARSEAEAIRIKGEALRENAGLVQLQAVEKWNGVLPVTMMGNNAVPFVSVPQGNNK